jgi:hypothetical protein
MSTIEITGGAVAATIAAGAYLRWGVKPVAIAFQLGRLIGRRG